MKATKLDLKKELKGLYKASAKQVSIVTAPRLKIISITGKGDPNTSLDFKNAIHALFPVAYNIKFACKKSGNDYTVMPLEGLWWSENMQDFLTGNKDNWQWKIFIVQPDFVTEKDFNNSVDKISGKKDLPALRKIKFEILNEGPAAQILHIGPFSEEGPTIEKLHAFIKENGYSFNGLKQKHHEIYLSDMRRTAPEKLKTIIRQPFVK